ncbi:MAG: hypothetical protein RL398_1778 [Planctomycetota bacterium]
MTDAVGSPWRRAAVALLLGIAGVAALAYGVGASEAAAGKQVADAAEAMAPPRPLPKLPIADGEVWLVAAGQPLPPGVAWSVAIAADGEVAVSQAPAAAQTPAEGGATAAPGALQLPVTAWGELSPAARGSLVEVVGRLVAERPVASDRFRTVGVVIERGQLDRLLAWVR